MPQPRNEQPEVKIPPESTILREAQLRSGMSQPQLAKISGIGRGTIVIYLQGLRHRPGKTKAPARIPDERLAKLGNLLGV